MRSFELLVLKAVHHYNFNMYKPVQDGIEKVVKSVVYTEDHPPAYLRELVHCFWELKTEAILPEDFHYHVIPDACVNILLNQMDTKVTAITALNVDSKKLNLGKLFHYVGIQLLPGVWQGSPGEIIKGFVDKKYKGKLPLIKFNQELTHLDFSAKQNVLTKLVDKLIKEKIVAPNVVTSEILKNINEIQTVSDMATFAKISTRQLQRTLKKTTGFSPHDFLKILRLQQSFKEDYLSHYSDQSHFIHSFRRVTGYTPGKYIKKYNV
ncbi:MAG: helix-turn-helix domain-containing protein [Pseudobdellovibrionaceae bacterium]